MTFIGTMVKTTAKFTNVPVSALLPTTSVSLKVITTVSNLYFVPRTASQRRPGGWVCSRAAASLKCSGIASPCRRFVKSHRVVVRRRALMAHRLSRDIQRTPLRSGCEVYARAQYVAQDVMDWLQSRLQSHMFSQSLIEICERLDPI